MSDYENVTNQSVPPMVLFSGGNDSVLTVARMIDIYDTVHIVTFDTGCIQNIHDRQFGKNYISQAYGERVIDDDIKNIYGIWQVLMRAIQDMSFTELYESYRAMSVSQTIALVNRVAMVSAAGILCFKRGITKLVVGDKMGDVMAFQQKNTNELVKDMMDRIFGIEYETPIWELRDEFEVKSELMLRGIPHKTISPECIIGGRSMSDVPDVAHVADGDCAGMFSNVLYPIVERMKDTWSKVLN